MFQRILLALDSSPSRRHTLQATVSLALLSGGSVHALHVAATVAAGTAALPLEDEQTAHHVLDEALRTLKESGVQADGELLQGFTTDIPALISTAAKRSSADLLVLGPHHRGIFEALFNPRVSDAVNRTSRIPVLLVPDSGAETG